TAFFKAISEGEREFEKITVAGGKDGVVTGAFSPCGVCRQVMAEFAGGELDIILAREDGYTVLTLDELLPYRFDKENLN
ncbi:MAG: cytidine deaminase, partial [Clostridia bacterium]|nr:cytidine deaminase [Clostridia bacterium]